MITIQVKYNKILINWVFLNINNWWFWIFKKITKNKREMNGLAFRVWAPHITYCTCLQGSIRHNTFSFELVLLHLNTTYLYWPIFEQKYINDAKGLLWWRLVLLVNQIIYTDITIKTIFLLYNLQGFQYFSSLPVLHYLQALLLIKIGTIFMNILYNTLENQEVPKTILGG